MSIAETLTPHSVEVRHTIDAAPDAVFDAWVTPELIEAWWGPEGFTSVVRELDLREGGRFLFEMIASNGVVSGTAGVFREIDRPRRLVFEFTEHCSANLPDGVEPQVEPSMVTVEFVAQGARTEIVLTHAGLHASYAELADFGWSSSFEKLARAAAKRG